MTKPNAGQSLTQRPPRAVALLGAQRFEETLRKEARALLVEGRVALITAGWQEREPEDEALNAHLEIDTVNLQLHRRADEVFAEDEELAAAHRERQTVLRHKQDFYRIRLEHELAANHVIRQRQAPESVLVEEEAASIAAIRALDAYHLAQCARVHAEFENEYRPTERPSVQKHRDEIREVLAGSAAIAIAGGNVASLLNRLKLFGIKELIDGHAILAWSGGAMVISQRLVLFHDSPPQGPGASEILDEGLGLVPDVVILPHPETRLRLHDPERASVLARRFAPARCLAFPSGTHINYIDGALRAPNGVLLLREDGSHQVFEEAMQ